MASEIVPVGQIDYKILATLLVNGSAKDISTATVKQIRLVKPSGTIVTGSGSFETDGTDGKVYYKTVSGDLDEEGWYTFRAYIELGSFEGYSEKGKFLTEAV